MCVSVCVKNKKRFEAVTFLSSQGKSRTSPMTETPPLSAGRSLTTISNAAAGPVVAAAAAAGAAADDDDGDDDFFSGYLLTATPLGIFR